MGGLITLASVNTHHGVLVGNPVPPKSDKDSVKPKEGDSETVTTQKEAGSSSQGTAFFLFL